MLASGLVAFNDAAATPRLRCELDQGGQLWQFEFAPTQDPYTPRPIDIGRHFRFKAVLIGNDAMVDYIKLYVYFQTARQPVLLQQLTYQAPQMQTEEAGPHALTGTVDVYSPYLGRQLRFGCALREVLP